MKFLGKKTSETTKKRERKEAEKDNKNNKDQTQRNSDDDDPPIPIPPPISSILVDKFLRHIFLLFKKSDFCFLKSPQRILRLLPN